MTATLTLLAVFVPFLVVPLILLLRRLPNPREAASVAGALLTFAFVAALIPSALNGGTELVVLFRLAPGLELAFQPDALGLLFAAVASFLWILTTLYSIGYLRGLREHAQTRYFAFFAAVMGATLGIALSANLFSLLIFYEVLTISTYPLVIHHEGEEDYAAGRKYLVYTLGGGGAILAGLALAYGTGETSLTFVAGGNPVLASPPFSLGLTRVVGVLLILGFGVKATLVPLHGWLPAAMVAPTPVSGLLHAVAVVKAGVFGILRTLHYLLGPDLAGATGVSLLALSLAAVTIVLGSLFALSQDNLKRRLAYSTISQLSYIVLGAALLTPAGLFGAGFHIAAHGFTKLTMFFVAGAVLVQTGKTRISEMDGVGRQMPLTLGAFAIAAVGMAALPPLSPFVSKFFLTSGAAEAAAIWPVLLLLTSSFLNMLYFFPIVVRSFLPRRENTTSDVPSLLLLPILVTALGALLLGVWLGFPGGPFHIAERLALDVFGTGAPDFAPWAPAHLLESASVVGLAVLAAPLAVWEFWVPGRPWLSSLLGRATIWISQATQEAFRHLYLALRGAVLGVGEASRVLQTGDLNWNAVGLALGLVIVLAALLLSVVM